MPSESKFFERYGQGDDIASYTDEDVYLTPVETLVHLTTTKAGTNSCYLPPADRMKNKMVSISLIAISTGTYVIKDNDESYDWSDITLDAAKDGALLWCDGVKYWVVTDNYT